MLQEQATSLTGYNRSIKATAANPQKYDLTVNGTQSKSLDNNNAITGYNSSFETLQSELLNMKTFRENYERLTLKELGNRFKPMLSYHKMLSVNRDLTKGEYCTTRYTLPATGLIDCGMFGVTDTNLYQV